MNQVRPQVKSISREVTFSGTVAPISQFEIRSPANTKVSKLLVKTGSRVTKDQPLLIYQQDENVNSDHLQAQRSLHERELELRNKRIALDGALKDYQRQKYLFERNIVSKQEYEAASRQYLMTRNDYQALQQGLKHARRLANQAQPSQRGLVKSPVAGEVVFAWVDQSTFFPGFPVNAGDVLLKVANLESLKIEAMLNARDIAIAKKGRRVLIYRDGISNSLLAEGMVHSASAVSVRKDDAYGTQGHPVSIAIRRAIEPLQVGMEVHAKIQVSAKDQAIVVPLSSIKFDGSSNYVTVHRGGAWVAQPVRLGLTNEFEAEIVSGITVNDVILME